MLKVVAIISGGVDSVGYAVIWKHRGAEIHPITFNYGQKAAKKEIKVSRELCKELGFREPLIVDISSLRDVWKNTQLTDLETTSTYNRNIIVPLRNLVFITIATAYAYLIQAKYVIYGAHLDDIKIVDGDFAYPDCNPHVAIMLETVLNLAHYPTNSRKVEIFSPAREGLTKAQILKTFYELEGDVVFKTYSCYRGEEIHCGICESCQNRKLAFKLAGITDKTQYEVIE